MRNAEWNAKYVELYIFSGSSNTSKERTGLIRMATELEIGTKYAILKNDGVDMNEGHAVTVFHAFLNCRRPLEHCDHPLKDCRYPHDHDEHAKSDHQVPKGVIQII